MSFWLTPLAPGRSRITLHLASANPELVPLPFRLLVRVGRLKWARAVAGPASSAGGRPPQVHPVNNSAHLGEMRGGCRHDAPAGMGCIPPGTSEPSLAVPFPPLRLLCVLRPQASLPPWVDHLLTRSAVFDGDNVFLNGQDRILAEAARDEEGASWRK